MGRNVIQLKDKNDNVYDIKDVFARDNRAPVITDTAGPADIVSISDGADGMPVKDMTVHIEPVQDLHGYDNPWPAGSGKNLVSKTISGATISSSGIISTDSSLSLAVAQVISGQTYTFSNDGSALTPNVIAYFSSSPEMGSESYDGTRTTGVGSTFTASYTGYICLRYTTSQGTAVQLEVGSSATSYVPYSNICPITGWTGAQVTRAGANVWDEEYAYGYFSLDGTWTANSTTVSSKNPIGVKPGTVYFLKTPEVGMYVTFWKKPVPSGITNTTDFIRRSSKITNGTFTTPDDCVAIHFNCASGYGSTYNHDISINYPATETAYHASHVQTYDITFPSPTPGTVYGGTLNPVTGKLVVDRAMVDLGTLNWSYNTSQFFFYVTLNDMMPNTSNVLSDRYVYVQKTWSDLQNGEFGTTSTKQARFHNDAYSTTADFKAAMSGAQFVYELAEPGEYYLTPVQITTLLGANTVWADCGPLEMEYRVDTNARKADKEPHNYAFDGVDLSTVFASAEAFHDALAAEDYSKIRIGDYWPLTLSGTLRDYGAYTVPNGTTYYTNAALTTVGGTTSEVAEGQYQSAAAVKFKVSGTDVYCAIGDCLPYFERTLNNAVVKLEVAGINNYWRYGDSSDFTSGKPHVTFVSRDCLPLSIRMRKANSVWEDAEATNPWRGSALYRTLNDPDYGVIKIIKATDIGAYLYGGPNGSGMRALMETKAAGTTAPTGWAWDDRGGLFLPFETEVWGHPIYANSTYCLGVNLQLPIFVGTRRHISKGNGNGGNRISWWTASTNSTSASYFCTVYGLAYPFYSGTADVRCVPVCFVMI